jgi:CheY-like chemotaxis protein
VGQEVQTVEPQAEFRKQVRDALEHLYDTAHLETHPLLSQLPTQASDSRLTRAQGLRGLLKEAIEALRPQEGAPLGSPEWRSYLALRDRYVKGVSLGEIELELGVSLRQLQRELHKGLDATAALLWEKRANAPASPAEGSPGGFEDELNQWESSRQSCDLHGLVDDTLWVLKPLLAECGTDLQADLPAELAPVFVDATLARQALFQVLRALVRHSRAGAISLRAHEELERTHILLKAPTRAGFDTEEDWQTAQLICRRQGLGLDTRRALEGGTEILLSLPRASQPRVLVIDDNAAIHQLFERYLAPKHYEMLHARDGQEALHLAATKHPDVITLDVMMPNVDGWQVLRGLTRDPATARIPVVICSVLAEPDLAFSLGASAYIKKPVDRSELLSVVVRLLSTADRGAVAPPAEPEDR